MRLALKRLLLIVVFGVLWPMMALADDRAEAETNLKKGNEFLKNGEYQKAISRFEIALKLAPELASPFAGIGFAYQGLGECVKANEAFQAYLTKTPEGKLSGDVKAGIAECKAKLFCRFSITSNPVGAEVRFGEQVVGVTPYSNEELKAGDYEVSVSLAGYVPYKFQLNAAAGKEYITPAVSLQKEGNGTPTTTVVYVDKSGQPVTPAPKLTWIGVGVNVLSHSKDFGFIGAGVELLGYKQSLKRNSGVGLRFSMNSGVDLFELGDSALLFELGALYRLTPYMSKLAQRVRWDLGAEFGLFSSSTGRGIFGRIAPGFLFPVRSLQVGFKPVTFGIDNFLGDSKSTIQLLNLSLTKGF
jgi:tetratricopeptide (TPR) repeat protein